MKYLAILLAAMVPWVAHAKGSEVSLRRFALVVGTNNGGAQRVRLRYATTDAAAIARVLEELGGVSHADAILLLDADRAALASTLKDLAARLTAARVADQRLELVFYYSGHSDDEGLLLGGQRFGYNDLRRELSAIPADVRVAIVDSCSSGALTRRKGGARRAPFLVDGSAAVRGHAFLTSSSEHEAAQESDRIQASYFTHYLISGLRGAADATPDGRVTLNEAYQYAFSETLQQTEKTQAGAQHPAYDIQLQGTGDSVMTDLRATSASLTVAAELSGRVSIRDSSERLVAELNKPVGRIVALGLEPGAYLVRLDRKGSLTEAQIELREGVPYVLKSDVFVSRARELTAMRGTTIEASQNSNVVTTQTDEGETRAASASKYPRAMLSVSLVPKISTTPTLVEKMLSLNIAVGESAEIRGVEFGLGINRVLEDVRGVQFAGFLNDVKGTLTGMQFSYVGNKVAGQAVGTQAALVFNTAGGGKLAQLSFGGNIIYGDARGIQITTGYNRAFGDFEGVQTGLVNVGSTVRGAQLGLVNIADQVEGSQIGLVNIADDTSATIGLVNVVAKGQLHADVWSSSDEPLSASVRYGSQRVYSMLVATILRRDTDFQSLTNNDWGVGFGLGAHWAKRSLFVDVDLLALKPLDTFERRRASNALGHLRACVGWQALPLLALYAGPMTSVLVSDGSDSDSIANKELIDTYGNRWANNETDVRLWPGFVVGLRI